MKEIREFSSYKGLDRTALFMGVPLLPAVALLTLSVGIMFIGINYFGIIGCAFVIVLLPVAFFLKTISENDDKAMGMMALELRYRLKRTGYKEFGNTLTYQPERYLRFKEVAQESFMTIDKVD